jgi:endonuclease YncB( thermonuclease family)
MYAVSRSFCTILAVIWCVFAGFGDSAVSATKARVIDGDTLELAGSVYRIHGIDAPEAGQTCARPGGGRWPCGAAAVAALEDLVLGRDIHCDERGVDAYGRILSVCRVGGQDIGAALVEAGLAWSFRRYSSDYDAVEDVARARGAGVWQARTETPWDYRANRWQAAVQQTPDGCPIKGNITRAGERIYHPPWSPWWSRTRVNEAAGERWFCDEAEALAAGWRAPYWGR